MPARTVVSLIAVAAFGPLVSCRTQNHAENTLVLYRGAVLDLAATDEGSRELTAALGKALCRDIGHALDVSSLPAPITADISVAVTLANYSMDAQTTNAGAWLSVPVWLLTWIGGLYIPDKSCSVAASASIVCTELSDHTPGYSGQVSIFGVDRPISLSFAQRVSSLWKWLLTMVFPPVLVSADDAQVRETVIENLASRTADDIYMGYSQLDNYPAGVARPLLVVNAFRRDYAHGLIDLDIEIASDAPLVRADLSLNQRPLLEMRDCVSSSLDLAPWKTPRQSTAYHRAFMTNCLVQGLLVPYFPSVMQIDAVLATGTRRTRTIIITRSSTQF